MNFYQKLNEINNKPKPFSFYTTPSLWNDEYISKKMLEFHLNEDVDLASRDKNAIAKSLAWLISKFNIAASTKICDFGCGPGLYTTRFAEEDAEVTGIDLSRRSLEYAKEIAYKKNLKIEYVLQNYLDFTTDKKFDLITMIYCDFCVLSEVQRKILLTKFCEFLAPGGLIVFDVFSLGFFEDANEARSYEYVEKDGFWSPNPYYVFQNNFKYENELLTLHKYTIFEEEKVNESYNWFQCYSLETVTQLLSDNGLTVVEYYSNLAGDPYQTGSKEIALVAKKL